MENNINFWIENSDKLNHQLFMFVMGFLYSLSFILGVSYKAVNIYCYFILYPLSFSLFLKNKVKYLILLSSLLFFIIPNFEELSILYFDKSVDFLNWSASLIDSNYINISIYLCVYVPIILYIPFFIHRFGFKIFIKTLLVIAFLFLLYLIFLYPHVKTLLVSLLYYIK